MSNPKEWPNKKQDLVAEAVNIYLTWNFNMPQHGGNLHLLMSRVYDLYEEGFKDEQARNI